MMRRIIPLGGRLYLRPAGSSLSSLSSFCVSPSPRYYSTHTEENVREDIIELKNKLLDGSLKHVPKLGWSIEAISASAKDLNLPGITHGLFPKGGYDLVEYFVTKSNKQLVEDSQSRDLSNLNVREKISTLVKARLSPLGPHIKSGRWSEAMSLLAHPTNAPHSVYMLAILADEIWYQAGDSSVDFDWYTKRAMLSALYTSAELYMLSDASEGFKDTWQYVDRRIDDMIAASRFKYEAEQAISSTAGKLFSLFAR